MSKLQDPNSVLKGFLTAFKVDTTAMEDTYKNTAALNEKLAGVVLEAAGKSSEVSAKWTAETIDKLTEISKAKSDPADYAKALADYAKAQAEIATRNITVFADLAKQVQLETVELLVEAGIELSGKTATSVNNATEEAVNAARVSSKK